MTVVLPFSAFWITRLLSFFSLHNDLNSHEGGEMTLLKAEKDVNAVSCERAFILPKSNEDSLLDFMSRNRNSNRIRNFEYSIFLG